MYKNLIYLGAVTLGLNPPLTLSDNTEFISLGPTNSLEGPTSDEMFQLLLSAAVLTPGKAMLSHVLSHYADIT